MDAPHSRRLGAGTSTSTTPTTNQEQSSDTYAPLSFPPASQQQILRASQRDTSQIRRLTELVSDILRSLAGTRWLAHRQTIVDLLVKAVYLALTFGRGSQTLGEEYTDILPYAVSKRRPPSARRRLMTILFLLLPSIITSPSAVSGLRTTSDPGAPSPWRKARSRLASFLSSPLGQSLPELHMIFFLFRGRFFEFGRRVTGVSHISTLPPRPPGHEPPSYEPLGFMLLLPLLFRLVPRSSPNREDAVPTTLSNGGVGATLPLSPPLTPPLSPQQLITFNKSSQYDAPNTYLTPSASALPERQCTLCLEPRGTGEGSGGTVAVTECGHIFCWGCLGGLDKAECPLCRQSLRMERLIAAYNL